ncbi:PREDICTED: peroxisomal and mitochondrial division factor 1-like [Tarenaya hassleriana]|uniref:peroxisomal and mitochondrial division factor 1-like n=1 Tax=Tarenaya hassleriana TaxID=28532 RepID=UPI00053C130E|nr:PREDICTED: peroxisomal and mitochondrial division factor 1-like [Tarenaya hassleriana]
MADEVVIDGDVDDLAAKGFSDSDQSGGGNTAEMKRRMEELEDEKQKLTRVNLEMKERLERLTGELEELRGVEAEMNQRFGEMEKEFEQAEEEKKALESIAARAVELETEVSRLQHDLISTMSAGDEVAAEVAELKKAAAEKGEKLEASEREVVVLRKARAETEKKVRDLERKVGILEVREMEEKSKKLRVEEEMREKIGGKEREISEFQKKIAGLKLETVRNGKDVEKCKWEKKLAEDALRESEKREIELGLKMEELLKLIEEAKITMAGLKEMIIESNNGIGTRKVSNCDQNSFLEVKSQQWPVLAAGSVGAVGLVAATLFVCYSKRG